MADQNDIKQEQTLNHANQEEPGSAGMGPTAGNIGGNPGSQHNDWGHSQAGDAGNAQSGQEAGEAMGAAGNVGGNVGGNIGGVPGSQHNDWGHSPVATEGNQQSAPRQGMMPGEEMGHLQRGQDQAGKRS